MKSDKSIVLVTQKNSEVDDPQEKDIFSYGCLSKILQLLKLPDGTVKVLVEGLNRVKINEIQDENKKYLSCKIENIEVQKDTEDKLFLYKDFAMCKCLAMQRYHAAFCPPRAPLPALAPLVVCNASQAHRVPIAILCIITCRHGILAPL